MSARREARARHTAALVTGVGGVPRSLLIGRCIEVWADQDAAKPPASAMRRFSAARAWWLSLAGIPTSEAAKLIPSGAPWSVEYLTNLDRAAGVVERLSRAGASAHDLSALRQEAGHLLALAADARSSAPADPT